MNRLVLLESVEDDLLRLSQELLRLKALAWRIEAAGGFGPVAQLVEHRSQKRAALCPTGNGGAT